MRETHFQYSIKKLRNKRRGDVMGVCLFSGSQEHLLLIKYKLIKYRPNKTAENASEPRAKTLIHTGNADSRRKWQEESWKKI